MKERQQYTDVLATSDAKRLAKSLRRYNKYQLKCAGKEEELHGQCVCVCEASKKELA